jgi:hypothetical protein
MDMVHLPGKGVGARRVPIILSPDVVNAMVVGWLVGFLTAHQRKLGY